MIKIKPLNAKQLAVVDDLFEGSMEESDILKKHNISRKLYNRWLADEGFNEHLNRRMAWEYRRCEFMLAHYSRVAASNLVQLTNADLKQPEATRKACMDIITMRANLLAGADSSGTSTLPESPKFSPETTGKLLAVLAGEETVCAS